ncbi:unnamed protein product, partial [Rotaria sordida]
NQSEYITEYLKQFSKLEKDYFHGYVYDTIWSLAYLYQSHLLSNQSISGIFKNVIENIDFIDATGRVRYLNGGRIGQGVVEQFIHKKNI